MYYNNTMYDQGYKPRGGYRGSPRGSSGGGARGGRGGWGGSGGSYYSGSGSGGQIDSFRGGRGGGYRGSRGGMGGMSSGYRTSDTGGYRGGSTGGYRGGFRGSMQQSSYSPRGGAGGYYGGGGYQRGGMRGSMGGGYRGQPYRGGMDHSRGGMMNKFHPQNRQGSGAPYRKSEITLFEEALDLDQRKRMVKLTLDNKLTRKDFEELMQMEGVIDLHMNGHMVADYPEEDEDRMLQVFQEAEEITQNGIPCYADLTGRRSKNHGKEGVRDLRRVDVRNLPEKTTIDMVKEAFPSALVVWKNQKFNFIELLFANEEEACEAILSGQQKEINGVLPYVMFHRENQADLTKRPREDDTTQQPAAKKVKDVEAGENENGEDDQVHHDAEEEEEENGGDEAEEEEAAEE
ncbi:keratin, type I cytoskeletal 9 isoform X2 [Hyalella azteca]|uniref:Keratin, type I cytoskeletal 9 isoform X2 n=1 Tax=Hyalella azteca TaxID=294128 RepID=A0A8B7P6F1_HYAAZ|nr:keratin, type I cytoskeletal 9 isoform X2 [Hyalella azteca]